MKEGWELGRGFNSSLMFHGTTHILHLPNVGFWEQGHQTPLLFLTKIPQEVCFTSTHHHTSQVNVAYDEVAACHPPMPHVAFRARVANSPVVSCHLGT